MSLADLSHRDELSDLERYEAALFASSVSDDAEPEGCDGEGYHDVSDGEGGVLGPRPCRGCPDCR